MLESDGIDFLMEAHDGLSAKIAERAGFTGLWASSLAMSSALGMRDSNELTATEVLEVVGWMARSTNLPIVVDGDSGHGNFNNARLFVRRLCQLGVAGVCLEDKQYPKLNSFCDGAQTLADPGEFAGKIRACKEAQLHPEFVVIARVEALIAGAGLEDALQRARLYRAAGADAVMIHSRQSSPDEICEFLEEWGSFGPVVLAPTTYGSVSTGIFDETAVRLVIWANQSLRAAAAAMERACREILETRSDAGLSTELMSIAELFSLLDYDELSEATERHATFHHDNGSDGSSEL